MRLLFRMPGWAASCRTTLNSVDEPLVERVPAIVFGAARFASATYEELALPAGTSRISLEFDMSVTFLRAHPKVRCDRGRIAIVRGPLVYCAEAVDNPGLNLDSAVVDPAALRSVNDPSFPGGGCVVIVGADPQGPAPRLVPYFLWANRGRGAMRVFLTEPAKEKI
jgi:DUF1680 family protein